MKIRTRKSKLWKLWNVLFPGADMKNIWICFNKTIWTPGYITEDLIVHEEVHSKQQKNLFNAIIWVIRYVLSKKFRYKQELPAYKAQLNFIVRNNKHNRLFYREKCRRKIAEILSGKTYGNIVTYEKAYQDLK